MVRTLAIAALLASSATTACAQRGQQPSGPVDPVATAPEMQGVRLVTVLRGLNKPWAIDWLPNGDRLITERPGRLLLIEEASSEPQVVRGTPDVLSITGGGLGNQAGLFDVSVHPEFEKNRLVYLTYAAGTREANRTEVARGKLERDRLTDVEVIFKVDQIKSGLQHYGSRMLWLPDNTFLLSIGDGGNPPVRLEGDWIRKQAQENDSDLGKVHHLKDDGSPTGSSPFADDAVAEPTLFSLGHRNIQGMARDPESGRVWATEHGARGGDELNLVERGKNYGWPTVTYSLEYHGPRISDRTAAPAFEDPKTVWTPCIAPCGLEFYTGDQAPAWQGDLFAGGLIGEQVRRVMLDGAEVVGQEQISVGKRVRDVAQGPDGFLYILTDETPGELIRIEPTSMDGE
jgi:aldose sugar dehydrogenase